MRTEQEVAGMACPVCRTPLAMSDRQGVEIDYCPQCRGVWLDRGELDKIIERSAAAEAAPQQAAPPPPPQAAPPMQQPWAQPAPPPGYGHGYGHGHGYHGKRKKHWLEDIFD